MDPQKAAAIPLGDLEKKDLMEAFFPLRLFVPFFENQCFRRLKRGTISFCFSMIIP
jgi:hypothetical protein